MNADLETVSTSRPRGVLRAFVVEMRPRQWTKNLVVLAPLLFSMELGRPHDALRATLAVVSLCLVSAAVYIVNDLHDLTRDRLHETRRLRPLAAGELDARTAAFGAALLLAAGLGISALLGPWSALIALSYVALQAAYTFALKNEVLIDVMAISAGFVLRVTAGAAAIGVAVSPWLLSCAALLALFLALVKRRHELLADPHALEHRPVLRQYTPALLDQAIGVVMSSTFVVYAIYTFLSQSATDRPYLMLTIPFVGYGLLRYLFLMHARDLGGRPEEILLSDLPLIIDLCLWAGVVVLVLYVT